MNQHHKSHPINTTYDRFTSAVQNLRAASDAVQKAGGSGLAVTEAADQLRAATDAVLISLGEMSIQYQAFDAKNRLRVAVENVLDKAVDQAVAVARAHAPDAPKDDLRAMCTRIAATRMAEDAEAVRPEVSA